MKALVLGCNGQLGMSLMSQAVRSGFNCRGLAREDLDITRGMQVKKVLDRLEPAVVINAAAYTDVDRAESEPDAAYTVNRDAVDNLAEYCRQSEIPIVHVSTDFVFDGRARSPYKESAPVGPLSVYGKSKAAGEEALRRRQPKHVIVRTAWLYSPYGKNFVKTILDLSRIKPELAIVNDRYGSPTSALDLAEAILRIAEQAATYQKTQWGTYHFCGQGAASWYDFASAVFETARSSGWPHIPGLTPVAAAGLSETAQRPVYSALDCSLIQRAFGITCRPWLNSLVDTVSKLIEMKCGPSPGAQSEDVST